jgi:hypothetical protein
MAHTNYRRKNKQNHHGLPGWRGKPSKSDRTIVQRKARQFCRTLIAHEEYDEIHGNFNQFYSWWW